MGTALGVASVRMKPAALENLVDVANGLISREIFVSDEIYQQELERVFARAWLFVGHESLIPNPGDYFVSSMGEESVILTRDHHREVHVFVNTCRHRGMKVCRYDQGNTTLFTCPYHGWSYGTDGRLAGVPYFKEAYRERLDKSKWGLIEVAQLANYKGTIWATWDPQAPGFTEYLGDMRWYLDVQLDTRDGREGGSEVIGGITKWYLPCNWKFAAENFIGDFYHGISHRSADLANFGPSGKGRGIGTDSSDRRRLTAISFPHGHGVAGLNVLPTEEDPPYRPSYQNTPLVEEYFWRAYQERQKRLAGKRRVQSGTGCIFPNATLHSGARHIAVWHPRGPLRSEAWRFFLVDKDAPEEVKDVLRAYYMRYSGPAGMTEQDDMENWNYASAASRGTIARRYPYNYEMGLELERPEEAPHGLVTTGVFSTEQNQRHFYRRWAELMDAESWAELIPDGPSESKPHA